MYENGEKVSSYHRKQLHKDFLKKNYLKERQSNYSYVNMSYSQYESIIEEKPYKYYYGRDKNIPCNLKYWHSNHTSKHRQFHKKRASKIARQHWRKLIDNIDDWEDFEGDTTEGNDYKMLFDVWWYYY